MEIKEFKIVICGGGSTYTAGIVKNLLDEKRLGMKELWLYDIDEERQNKVAYLVREVVKENRPEVTVKTTTDPKEAFTDADFIMAQMRVGGLPMRVQDEQISLKHGVIGQETCGAGGMAYGMRTIYPMVQLIDYCEEYAKPTYWIVNYSNPAAIVAKATQKMRPNARIINICDMPVEIEARLAEILGCQMSDLEVDYFGLNHYGWFTKIRQNGIDVTEKLKEHVRKYGYISEASMNDVFLKDPDWVHTFKASAKIANYFPDYLPNTYYQYYLLGDDMYKYMDINHTRGMQVINGREVRVFAAADKLAKGEAVDMNQFYVGVHGVFIVNVVTSLAYDLRSRQLVMVPNNGCVENLPDDAMVEVPTYITSHGPEPIRVGAIPRFYKGLIEQQDACEGLLVEAAMEHSYVKALEAYTMNRTIPSANVAKEILDDMIEANKGYWPELK
ncbi:6-phospho-alpha-glucosidase [Solobacterium moorei]